MRKNVHRQPRRPAGRRRRPEPRGPAPGRAGGWSLYAATGRRKYLNGDERRRFIAAALLAPPKLRTLCLTLAYTGCRISEALALTVADIEVPDGLIAIRSLKQRGERVMRQVPLPPGLLDDLAAVHRLGVEADPDRRLWSWRRTRAWQLVKTVMATAGVRQLPGSPRGLRHGFGVHAILSGVPITLVQKWLGHADVATTAIYTDVLGPEERAIAERMWSER